MLESGTNLSGGGTNLAKVACPEVTNLSGGGINLSVGGTSVYEMGGGGYNLCKGGKNLSIVGATYLKWDRTI